MLDLVVRGLSNSEIADGPWSCRQSTVKTHLTHVLDKLGLRDRVQAVVYGYEHGLVEPGAAGLTAPRTAGATASLTGVRPGIWRPSAEVATGTTGRMGHTSTDADARLAADGWLGACWRYPRNVVLALAGTLVVSRVGIAIPLIQRQIVDSLTASAAAGHLAAGGRPDRPRPWPTSAALYLRRYRGGQLSLDVQHDLRTELFGSLSRLDGTRQDELHTGQIVSRSISDITMVQGLLSMVPMLMGNLVLFAGSLVAMAFLSPLLTLIALAVGPALWFVSLASRRTLFPASWDAQQQAAGRGGGGRRGGDRGAGGEGLRPGGAGDRAARGGQRRAVRLPGAGGPAARPLQPGPAGDPGAGPGGGAGAGRLAGPARAPSAWARSWPSPPT